MSEVVEHLDLRTGRFRPLLIWKIAWTVTQATYRERFSPMAVAEVCCLYWLFLLRGYIASRLVRSARATPWMTPYSYSIPACECEAPPARQCQ